MSKDISITALATDKEIASSLDELTDEEIIECKVALKDRAYNIMSALSELVEETENE